MFPFPWRVKPATAAPKTIQASTRVIWFDPARIVRGVTFHLLDEGKARGVSTESSESAVNCLARRVDHPAIAADKWAAMENPQRLQWLLDQGRIVVRAESPGFVKLCVRE
jgi:hypothetical protein